MSNKSHYPAAVVTV